MSMGMIRLAAVLLCEPLVLGEISRVATCNIIAPLR